MVSRVPSPERQHVMETPLGRVAAAPGVLAHTCYNCGESVAASECTPWSKMSWSCKQCKSNYNRFMERCRQSPKLRAYWKNMTSDQRQDWFLRNKS
eukprot:2698485-Alexandrium_andersonii.AAC.1